jgi:inorganic pyrophosphatase
LWKSHLPRLPDDPRFDDIADLGDLPKHWLAEIENFFETYKLLEGGATAARGWSGSSEAKKLLEKYQCQPSSR